MLAQVIITLGADGRVQVSGSVGDRLTTLGLLAVATDAVLRSAPESPAVQEATGDMARALLAGRNGV